MNIEVYMEAEGLEGESHQPYSRGEIPILSFSHAFSPSESDGMGGESYNTSFVINKVMDKSSPKIYVMAFRRELMDVVRIHLWDLSTKTDEGIPRKLATITLRGVYFNSVSYSGSSDIPYEALTLQFKAITWEYFLGDAGHEALGLRMGTWDNDSREGSYFSH